MHSEFLSIILLIVGVAIFCILLIAIENKRKINELTKDTVDLNDLLCDKNKEIQTANRLLSEYANKEKHLNQELSTAKEDLKKLLAENNELKNFINILQTAESNVAVSVSTETQAENKISELQKMLADSKQYYESKNEQQRSAMARTVSQLLESKARLEEEILFLKKQLEQSFGRIDESDIRIFNLHQWISDTCGKALSICQSSVFSFDWDGDPDCLRLYHALDEKIIPHKGINVQANFTSQDTGEVYETTLRSCTCKDFKFNTKGAPCKHMYALALQLGIFLVPDRVDLHALLHDYAEQKSQLDQQKKEIFRIVNTRSQRSPWLAEQLAQYKYERELAMIDNIPRATKKDVMKEISDEKRAITKERNMLKHQLHYLCLAFPWIEEFITKRPSKEMTAAPIGDPDWEAVSDYLSPDEYAKLSNTEKYQLALDRYEKRHRSRSAWEAGIIYERFVGYFYEQNGYAVQYRGALDGYDDLGRDIIASKDGKTHIIQCKRWSQAKTIHEKHIFQLYGSTILYRVDHPNIDAIPVFVTTTALSDRAAAIARELNIVVYSNVEMISYPKIKCNIGKDGEKIYHLPFDQQYDKIVITPETGERYCTTVAEAESYGFRRAKKWVGSQTPAK